MPAVQYKTEEELCEAAREAWRASGMTQTAAAEDLGVTQSTLSQAVNEPQRSLTRLRISIVERFTDYRVEGPLYRFAEGEASAEV